MLKHKLKNKKIKGVKVYSCGTNTFAEPINELAERVLTENNVKLKPALSKPVTEKMVGGADAVIGMTFTHIKGIKSQNCVDFTMLYGLAPIADPFGGEISAYRRTYSALNVALDLLVADIECGSLAQKIKLSIEKFGR